MLGAFSYALGYIFVTQGPRGPVNVAGFSGRSGVESLEAPHSPLLYDNVCNNGRPRFPRAKIFGTIFGGFHVWEGMGEALRWDRD